MTTHELLYTTTIPHSPAEAAASTFTWERRGLLGRLVHIDGETLAARVPRNAPRATRQPAAAARSL